LHGLYLSVERWLRQRFKGFTPGRASILGLALLTFLLINVTWVFFRAKDFGTAWRVLRGMLGLNGDAKPILPTPFLVAIITVVGGIVLAHWLMRDRTLESVAARVHPALLTLILGSMAFLIVISQGAGNAFIYFQF